MDNKTPDLKTNPDLPNMIVSSGMIINQFGGLERLA
jgi:hypothetical protein